MGSALKCTELKAIALAGFDAGRRGSQAPGTPRKALCFFGSNGIDADADAHHTDRDQLLGHPIVDQHAIGTEHHQKPSFTAYARSRECPGRTSGSPPVMTMQTALIDLGDLIDQAEALFGREFIVAAGRLRGRIEVAMVALEITALGKIQRDKIGLEVVHGPSVIWTFGLGPGVKNCVSCC